jgi:cytidine deaminase
MSQTSYPVTAASYTDQALFEKAQQAAASAYSPYSQVKVGCALVTTSGQLYQGCNVENASYGLTICAERVAIGNAVAAEGPEMRWTVAAAVALDHEFPPCGACRQVLHEFAAPGARVLFLCNGDLLSMKITDLLPASFQKDQMHL